MAEVFLFFSGIAAATAGIGRPSFLPLIPEAGFAFFFFFFF